VKRRALIRHLTKHGCEQAREGSRHTGWWNPENRQTSTVPRHAEVNDHLAKKICKDLGIPKP
jgi:mRNA interferase HicA